MWYCLQAVFYAWYERIEHQGLHSTLLHTDESGWRVDGKPHLLWCLATRNLACYMIDRCRGSPVLVPRRLPRPDGVPRCARLGDEPPAPMTFPSVAWHRRKMDRTFAQESAIR